MLAPLDSDSWTLEHAAHLLNRAGFGGAPARIRDLHAQGLPRAVDELLNRRAPQLSPPEWAQGPVQTRRQAFMEAGSLDVADQEKRLLNKEFMRGQRRQITELRVWWLERMRQSRDPLLEKMTLFWHGHFATSFVKVNIAWDMWRQNETLRSYALGNFEEMLRAMTRDPAMIRWLDLDKSKDGRPNENFAREVLELFTLGEGHYTEQDIKEAARAFTGHRVDPDTQEFFFARRVHDSGEKAFLGQHGDFNADDIARIILAQPQCPRFLARRIWEFFAYENPEPAILDAAAETLRRSDCEMKPLLRAIFTSRAFYSPRALRTQIKSPVDWIVSACIALDASIPRQPALDLLLARLGQLPFEPPNVRGWEGGKSWISSSTLVLRYNLAGWLLGNRDPDTRKLVSYRQKPTADMQAVAPDALRKQPDALADAMVFRLFGTPQLPRMQQRARESLRAIQPPIADADVRGVCQRLMSTPDYQLT